ncbi:MAG: D-alanyl-D-alanine carboxypeptidase family protein [Pseudomonadota bacterium]|nr:D-alanyl-D-alanine carboxypeptidase family protein [Pseudomonadota bacterium]
MKRTTGFAVSLLLLAAPLGVSAVSQDDALVGETVVADASPGNEQSIFTSSASVSQALPEIVRAKIPPSEIDAASWILMDFGSGWVLGSKHSDQRIEPASLTKLMTGYLVFEALKAGKIKLQDQAYISKRAWRTSGSKMFVQVDTRVAIGDLLKGLIIQSGNDAALVLAEHLGGSEEGFAAMMNQKGAELGLANSHFTNPHGLPDPEHYSTARDLTLLARAIIRDFPEEYKLYSVPEFTYNDITQQNRNILLRRDPTVDGVKTGYTAKAGYCLIGSAKRDGMRLLATVTGARGKIARADAVQTLLQYGYANYESMRLYGADSVVREVPLFMGTVKTAAVGVGQDFGVVFPRGTQDQLSASLDLPETLDAPLAAGVEAGNMTVKYGGEDLVTQPLRVLRDYPEGAWWSQGVDSVRRWFY